MNTLPNIGGRTLVFARVIAELAGESSEVRTSDDVLVHDACILMPDGWKVPGQAVRDALSLLERVGALTYSRRRRGPSRPEVDERLITVNRDHWLWSVLSSFEVGCE